MRDGRSSSPVRTSTASRAPRSIFDVVGHSETPVGGLTPPDSHGMAPSVLLPPAQAQKVMTLGGGGPAKPFPMSTSSTSASRRPTTCPDRRWRTGARCRTPSSCPTARCSSATGGGLEEDPSKAELRSEIYDPAANAWRPGATAVVPRLYHSVALLLPDGRVITAGSNPHRRDDELRLELYHPPYLFRGPRPFIESAPSAVTHAEAFEIHTPQADAILADHQAHGDDRYTEQPRHLTAQASLPRCAASWFGAPGGTCSSSPTTTASPRQPPGSR